MNQIIVDNKIIFSNDKSYYVLWRQKSGIPIPVGKGSRFTPVQRTKHNKKKITELKKKRVGADKEGKSNIDREIARREKHVKTAEVKKTKTREAKVKETKKKEIKEQEYELHGERKNFVTDINVDFMQYDYGDSGITISATDRKKADKAKLVLDKLPRDKNGKIHKDFRGTDVVVAPGTSRDHILIQTTTGNAAGVAYRGHAVVFEGATGRGKMDFDHVVLHEVGHQFANKEAPSGWGKAISSDFSKGGAITNYAKTTRAEDWAESFSYWRIGKMKRKNQPARMKFMEDVFK